METRPVLTRAPSDHQHQMADPEAMEAAMTEEAFLQEKEGGKMKVEGWRTTNAGLGGTTPAEMAMVMTATTTRDERGGDPQHRDVTFAKTERCSPGAERGKGKKSGFLTFLRLHLRSPFGWTRLRML